MAVSEMGSAAQADDGEAHHGEGGDQKAGAERVRRAVPWAIRFYAQQGDCKSNAEIEGQHNAMLPAARERADAELQDCGLETAAEGWCPVGAAGRRHQVRIFDCLAHGAHIAEEQGSGCANDGDAEADPGALGQPAKGCRRPADQLIEERKEPVRRGPRQQTLDSGPGKCCGEVIVPSRK